MDNFLYFYIEANIVCICIAAILIFRELKSVDKQLRNIEFVKTVFAYILLYIVDIIWCVFELGYYEKRSFYGHVIYFLIFAIFTYGSSQWFIYSEVAQGNSEIYKLKNRIKWTSPIYFLCLFFLIYTIIVFNSNQEKEFLSYVNNLHFLMVITAFFYEVISSVKSLKRAYKNKKQMKRGLYIFMGINPIIFSSFIILQFIFSYIPIFCFLNTVLMLCFYFNSLDDIISIDPLTKLNNRNQLTKYFHQIQKEDGMKNYILVIDIDNFKSINDKYGHLEGDNALILVADTFKNCCGKYQYKSFLSRYGGDEFVIIVQAFNKKEVEQLKSELNRNITLSAANANKNYNLTVSIGIAKIKEDPENLERCLAKADKEMYLEKNAKASAKIK